MCCSIMSQLALLVPAVPLACDGKLKAPAACYAGAGKRHDHSSNAAADDGSGKRKQSNKQPKQHRGLNPHAMAPTEQVRTLASVYCS